MNALLSCSGRTGLLVVVALGLTGCPERQTNRGTDVPVDAGDRLGKDSGANQNPSGEDKPTAATAGDKEARDVYGNAPEPEATQ